MTIRVCFYSHSSYGLFDPSSKTPFGGAEVRATRFARGLAARPGFDVACLVRNEGQPPRQRFGKLAVVAEPPTVEPPPLEPDPPRRRRTRKRGFFDHVYLLFRHSADRAEGFPWVRINQWSPHLLWQTPLLAAHFSWRACRAGVRRLRRRNPIPRLRPSQVLAAVDCDVVCGFGVNNATAALVAECRRRRLTSVLFLASEQDIWSEYQPRSRHIGPHGDYARWCRYAIDHADHLVVQTEYQQRMLAERFGRRSTLIRNPVPPVAAGRDPLRPDDRFVLWIGRAERAYKRPELCIELARRCPEVPIVMVLNPAHRELFNELVASAPANVRIVERVPFDEIDAYFHHAALFVNTSRLEGFPNTFLQAASHGVPILSLNVDPDGFVSRGGCGLVAQEDMERLAAELRRLWSDRAAAEAFGAAGRRYVAATHGLEGRIDELTALLQAAVAPRRLRLRPLRILGEAPPAAVETPQREDVAA